jgi:chemotaxis protein MotB
MKFLSIAPFALSALFLGGCSNLQTEYEKQSEIIREQKVIISELTETNAYLKAENMRLDTDLKKAQLHSDYQKRVDSLSSVYEQKLQQMIASLNQQLDSSLNSMPEVSIRKTSEGTVITMADSILFRPGSADLSDSGKNVLNKVTAILKDYPEKRVRVDGHTDSDPILRTKSKYSSNWDLSATRAVHVVEQLTENSGIKGDRIFVAAYSKFRPVDPKDKKLNRRVEIVVLDN